MAIAAAISVPLTSPIRRRNSLILTGSSSSSSTIQLSFPKHNIAGLCPRFRISASAASSMSTQAPQKVSTAPTSFLDRREAGFLHFVKYHGLGNDFILVINSMEKEFESFFFFFWFRI